MRGPDLRDRGPEDLFLSPENRMRFWGDPGDKSEIRVAGGLNKGDPRSMPGENPRLP